MFIIGIRTWHEIACQVEVIFHFLHCRDVLHTVISGVMCVLVIPDGRQYCKCSDRPSDFSDCNIGRNISENWIKLHHLMPELQGDTFIESGSALYFGWDMRPRDTKSYTPR